MALRMARRDVDLIYRVGDPEHIGKTHQIARKNPVHKAHKAPPAGNLRPEGRAALIVVRRIANRAHLLNHVHVPFPHRPYLYHGNIYARKTKLQLTKNQKGFRINQMKLEENMLAYVESAEMVEKGPFTTWVLHSRTTGGLLELKFWNMQNKDEFPA